jgi:archaellum component FlaG (FlaF/FlaG flagellin family)
MQEDQIPQTPTVDSPQTTVTQTVDENPKKNNFLVILLFILMLLALVIAGFFAYQTQKLAKELSEFKNQNLTTPTSEPESTFPMYTEPNSPTADWKTYTNTKYNFSFKYPFNFGNEGVVSGPYSIKSSDSVDIISFSDPDTIREGTDAPFDGFSVYYVEDLNAQSFEEFLLNEKTTMDNAAYASMTGAKRILLDNKGIAFVNDTRGYYYYPLNGGQHALVFAYIQKDNNFRSIFNQILATLKFTN